MSKIEKIDAKFYGEDSYNLAETIDAHFELSAEKSREIEEIMKSM